MPAFIAREPWSRLLSESEITPIPQGGGQSFEADGAGSPRLVLPCKEGIEPRYGARRSHLIPVSFPFQWKDTVWRQYALPTNPRPTPGRHLYAVSMVLGTLEITLTQSNMLGRPGTDEDEPLSLEASVWIDWQINCFKELTQVPDAADQIEQRTRKGLSRRSWKSVHDVWLQSDGSDALMHLIVELARDGRFRDALQSISTQPRRILERIRTAMRVERIQEFDPVCIRDFARRPGISVYEKAGAKQELLGVARRESMDTLENRVTCWVLETMVGMAQMYRSEFSTGADRGDEKCGEVEKLLHQSREWRGQEALTDVRTNVLQHPVHPNYPLQYDVRYREVYRNYDRILRNQRVLDDCWAWQRVLWADSARQILFSAMSERLREMYVSTPYYRMENVNGQWTAAPLAPGPFRDERGGVWTIYDSRDVSDLTWVPDSNQRSLFAGASLVGATGCDTVLHRDSRGDRREKLVLVWYFYWTADQGLPRVIQRCREAIKAFRLELPRKVDVRGLLISSDPAGSPEASEADISFEDNHEHLMCIRTPFQVRRFPDALRGVLQQALDSILTEHSTP